MNIWANPVPRIASHTVVVSCPGGSVPCLRQQVFAHPFRGNQKGERPPWIRGMDKTLSRGPFQSWPSCDSVKTSFLSHVPWHIILHVFLVSPSFNKNIRLLLSSLTPHARHRVFLLRFTQTKVSYHPQLRTQSGRNISNLSGQKNQHWNVHCSSQKDTKTFRIISVDLLILQTFHILPE